ncbi:MAG: zinc ribbon domain-containing protein [Atopobiaceae bacterium]|nr:zinc ribbon domain-containing protein [Atopobiaceae bacterium]
MQCPHCGRQIANGARFCPVCGKEVAANAGAPQRVPQQAYQQRPQQMPRQAAPYAGQNQRPNPYQRNQPAGAPPQMRQAPMQQNVQMYGQAGSGQSQSVASGSGKPLAIVSLTLGILGMICAIILHPVFGAPPWVEVIALVFGVAGIVTACVARQHGFKTPLSMAGLVCSIIATVASVLVLLFILALVSLLTGLGVESSGQAKFIL